MWLPIIEIFGKRVKKMKEDYITKQRIKILHPLIRDETLKIYHEILKAGVGVRFTDTLRTFSEQNILFAKGRTTAELIEVGVTDIKGAPNTKRVTNARGGYSYHNFGLAIDFCLLRDNKSVSWNRYEDMDADGISDWMEIVKIFKKYGWEWGGNFKSFRDYPHFQKTFGYNTKELRAMYESRDGDYVNIPYAETIKFKR